MNSSGRLFPILFDSESVNNLIIVFSMGHHVISEAV